jgi:uncharacterized membrane protein YeaQ/YmgE (transglycosylase-associated protein family)
VVRRAAQNRNVSPLATFGLRRGLFITRPTMEATVAAETLIIFLVVGAVAGWLAGVIVRGYGLGLVGNIVVGVIGSFIGGWLFIHFHLVHGGGLLGDVIGATVGAVILLFLIRLVRRRTVFQRFFQRRL